MDTESNPTPAVNPDSSAAVKAAAWAWYQHGSGASDSPSTAREYDVTRRLDGSRRPSRFKLEAARLAERRSLALLDAYEIDRISRHLDSLVARSNRKDSGFSDEESVTSVSSSFSTSSTSSSWSLLSTAARRAVKGFWMRRGASACGARDGGVVDATCRPLNGWVRHGLR